MTRTFLDAGVLIAAIRGTPEIADRVMALLNDPERIFISSDVVQLEVSPKAVYFRQTAEASFYQAYFASGTEADLGRRGVGSRLLQTTATAFAGRNRRGSLLRFPPPPSAPRPMIKAPQAWRPDTLDTTPPA